MSVDVYTAAYRISGTIETRFSRITEILNQLTGAHLTVERATISEYADPSATLAAPSALVAGRRDPVHGGGRADRSAHGEMRVPKRPVRAQLAIPPFRITGTVHIPMGSRPVDGLASRHRSVHGHDRRDDHLGQPPGARADGAGRSRSRRRRAHVLLVADDENPDELLAEVLDERTAEAWLRADEAGGG